MGAVKPHAPSDGPTRTEVKSRSNGGSIKPCGTTPRQRAGRKSG